MGCGMVSLHESFHVAGVPAGAILREMSDRALTTITCFQIPGGPLVHNESRIEFDHDVFGWTLFSYAEHGNDLRIEVARDDRFAHGCVPSYAELMVIRGMLLAGKTRLSFTTLDDSDASARPNPTELSITSEPGSIDKAGTVIPTTGHVVLRVNGEVRNRHWLAGTTVVASDWNGARSYTEPTLSDSLIGLDSQVDTISHNPPKTNSSSLLSRQRRYGRCCIRISLRESGATESRAATLCPQPIGGVCPYVVCQAAR